MANRVNAEEVKEIIDTELSDTRIGAFITAANTLINDKLLNKGLASSTLKEIERWLAAHYISASIERQAIEEEAGPASQKFSDFFSQGLNSTTYGQTARTLDPSGTLTSLDLKTINLKAIPE